MLLPRHKFRHRPHPHSIRSPQNTRARNRYPTHQTRLKTQSPDFQSFEWQNGYGAFSVSASNIQIVTDYITGQQNHHAKQSFQDELRAFLKRHQSLTTRNICGTNTILRPVRPGSITLSNPGLASWALILRASGPLSNLRKNLIASNNKPTSSLTNAILTLFSN